MRKYGVFLCLIMILMSSCLIYKQEFRLYETGVPWIYEYGVPWICGYGDIIQYEDIIQDKQDKYSDYVFNDLYFALEARPTSYYPGKIVDKQSKKRLPDKMTEGAPYELILRCVTQSVEYEKVEVEDCVLISNLNNSYVIENKLSFKFEYEYKGKDKVVFEQAGGIQEDLSFKHEENEIITVKMKIAIYDKSGNVFYKDLEYQLTPKIQYKYFDFFTDHM